MSTKKMFDGNGAAAEAIRLARPKVLAIYPITPQSTISERLAEMVDFHELDAKYIRVESEHSAMSAVVAASLTGVRATTATASQGLALMTEVLSMASSFRTQCRSSKYQVRKRLMTSSAVSSHTTCTSTRKILCSAVI